MGCIKDRHRGKEIDPQATWKWTNSMQLLRGSKPTCKNRSDQMGRDFPDQKGGQCGTYTIELSNRINWDGSMLPKDG